MTEKIAPVQGYAAGIPWSMHLRAYDAYCKKYGPQHALIDLEGRGCRGGFGVSELDMFIPGWREELLEINRLKSALRQFADPANWHQEVGCLQWMGKRNAIDFAEEVLRGPVSR